MAGKRNRTVNARVDTRANALATQIARLLARLAKEELARALRDPERYAGIAKADESDWFAEELRVLLLRYGLRAAGDAAKGSAGRQLVPESLIRDAIAGKPVNIKWFETLATTAKDRASSSAQAAREEARASVKRILVEANAEEIKPGAAEVARRIRTAMRGPGVEHIPRVHAEGAGEAYVFSFEHAMTIARTEMVQAENTGIVAGYAESGVERIEWQAYRDGRSGSRHHERMDGKVIDVGDYFTLPSGAQLRYPGDPAGPIGETINCRCTVGAVVI